MQKREYPMSVHRQPKTGKPPKGQKVKWIVRYRDPSGKGRSKTFHTETEAKDFESDQRSRMRRGEWVDIDGAPRLTELWTEWENAAKTPGTKGVRQLVGKNLGDLASMKVTRIKPSDLRTWLAHLENGRPWKKGCTGLSTNTRSTWWTQLSGCLHLAVIDEIMLVNPCSKVSGPGSAEPVDPRSLPSLASIQAVVVAADASERDTLATMIMLALSTGMRGGEVAGLRWENVDRAEGIIRVVEQARQRQSPSEPKFAPVKTKASRRQVPVPPEVMQRLRKHRLSHPVEPGQAMFATASGRMWNSELIGKALRAITKEWTFHDLRHVYASHMIRSGRSVKAVQSMLGHASATTTLDTYTHLWPDEDDLVRESASRLMCDLSAIGG